MDYRRTEIPRNTDIKLHLTFEDIKLFEKTNKVLHEQSKKMCMMVLAMYGGDIVVGENGKSVLRNDGYWTQYLRDNLRSYHDEYREDLRTLAEAIMKASQCRGYLSFLIKRT